MNISEALRKIKKLKGDIAQEQSRVKSSVSWIKGKTLPVYNFKESMDKLQVLSVELVSLESKVAEKNAVTKVTVGGKEMSLCEAIRTLQEVKSSIALYRELVIDNSVSEQREYVYDEEKDKNVTVKVKIEHESAITERERDTALESLKERFDIINSAIENANHKTSL